MYLITFRVVVFFLYVESADFFFFFSAWETSDRTFSKCVKFILCIHLGKSPKRTFRKERPLVEKQNDDKEKVVGRSCLSHSKQRKIMFRQVVLDGTVPARVFRSSNYLRAPKSLLHFDLLHLASS